MNSFTTHGPRGSTAENGTTFLQSRFDTPDNHTSQSPPSERLENFSGLPLRVITSSGQSYTRTELCMCTDYSKPLTGQIALNLDVSPTRFGAIVLNGSAEAKCVECGKMRPSRLMSVSM